MRRFVLYLLFTCCFRLQASYSTRVPLCNQNGNLKCENLIPTLDSGGKNVLILFEFKDGHYFHSSKTPSLYYWHLRLTSISDISKEFDYHLDMKWSITVNIPRGLYSIAYNNIYGGYTLDTAIFYSDTVEKYTLNYSKTNLQRACPLDSMAESDSLVIDITEAGCWEYEIRKMVIEKKGDQYTWIYSAELLNLDSFQSIMEKPRPWRAEDRYWYRDTETLDQNQIKLIKQFFNELYAICGSHIVSINHDRYRVKFHGRIFEIDDQSNSWFGWQYLRDTIWYKE